MSIIAVKQTMAVAKLNQLSFSRPLAEVATQLAAWQISKGSRQVPLGVSLSELKSATHKSLVAKARAYFANKHPQASARPQILRSGDKAWCLGDARNQSNELTLSLAKAHPDIYIRLVLMSELLSTNAVMAPSGESAVFSSLGPSVYFNQGTDEAHKIIKAFRADFLLSDLHNTLTCDISRKVFYLKKQPGATGNAKKSSMVNAGAFNVVTLEQLNPDLYGEADAREYSVKGLALDKNVRNSRIYYLNVLVEQVSAILAKAGVPFHASSFVATHQVANGFVNADEVAYLQRPLSVIWNTATPLPEKLPEQMVFAKPFGYSGNKKSKFESCDLSFESVPASISSMREDRNYLFLNDRLKEGSGSISVEDAEDVPVATDAYAAYKTLEDGQGKADLYTTVKYRLLMDTDVPKHVFQAMHEKPECVVKLLAGAEVQKKADDGEKLPPHMVELASVAEPLRRCLMELSIKEIATGVKPLPQIDQLAAFPKGIQLVATRRLKLGRGRKTLVSSTQIQTTPNGAMVVDRKTSKWSEDEFDLDDFVDEFPFLRVDGKKAKDQEFWIIDLATGHRLRVSAGKHVPKIILNDRYESFEGGLQAQLDDNPELVNFTKKQVYNLFPYYISSVDAGASEIEINSRIVSLQTFDSFVRVFIAPAGGINAGGSSLSLFRDVLVYNKEGNLVEESLIDHPLVSLYVHNFTSGILVIGENSKMTLLEKIAKLGIEN